MEDVLAVYELPYEADYPVACMDESNKQLVGEVHAPIPMGPVTARSSITSMSETVRRIFLSPWNR
jgi:hypothetical protein